MQRRLREIEEYPQYAGLRHPLDVLASPHGPWEVGAGVILSADCADANVNLTLPKFLAVFPTPDSARVATVKAIVPHLPGISHRGHKAEYLICWANYLVERGGDVGNSVQALTQVRGIGRKSAALILYRIKGIDEGMPLDTHALQVLDRLGWFPATRNPAVREKQLSSEVPVGHRHRLFLSLTHHGRQICLAHDPQCGACCLREQCAAARQNLSIEHAAADLK
jgi:endonuclease-3